MTFASGKRVVSDWIKNASSSMQRTVEVPNTSLYEECSECYSVCLGSKGAQIYTERIYVKGYRNRYSGVSVLSLLDVVWLIFR